MYVPTRARCTRNNDKMQVNRLTAEKVPITRPYLLMEKGSTNVNKI